MSQSSDSVDMMRLLKLMNGGLGERHYEPGEYIFRQGDPAESVFHIKSGEIKLTVSSEQGKEAVIAILDRDHFFGEGCMAGQNVRMSTAIVHTPTEIIKVDK